MFSLESPRRGGSNEYHNLCFEQKYEKYQNFSSVNFLFLVVKISVYLNRHVFVMKTLGMGSLITKDQKNMNCTRVKYEETFHGRHTELTPAVVKIDS